MIEIVFKNEENRAVAYDNDKEIGECTFVENENTWNIVHTGVDNSYQGQGIAKKLVNCIIENAKKENKKQNIGNEEIKSIFFHFLYLFINNKLKFKIKPFHLLNLHHFYF